VCACVCVCCVYTVCTRVACEYVRALVNVGMMDYFMRVCTYIWAYNSRPSRDPISTLGASGYQNINTRLGSDFYFYFSHFVLIIIIIIIWFSSWFFYSNIKPVQINLGDDAQEKKHVHIFYFLHELRTSIKNIKTLCKTMYCHSLDIYY